MKRLPCRPIVVLLIALHTASCATWRPVVGTPSGMIQDEDLHVARVTLISGERVVLREPRVTADSIVGIGTLPNQSTGPSSGASRIALPISAVRTVEEQVPGIDRAARNVGLVVVGGVAVATASLYVLCFLKYVCG